MDDDRDQIKVRQTRLTDPSWGKRRGATQMYIKAGFRGIERIVPPAGEEYAFNIERWARRITVHVSPTGRSVRVWVDGKEIPKEVNDE